MLPFSLSSESCDDGQQYEEVSATIPLPKKRRTFTPWTPAEEQRLEVMRDVGNSWGEIAKTFPHRTEGSVKKHWYKDMHYADFTQDDNGALLAAIREYDASKGKLIKQKIADFDQEDGGASLAVIREYEASKWKFIGQKVGKPAKACEQYANELYSTLLSQSFAPDNAGLSSLLPSECTPKALTGAAAIVDEQRLSNRIDGRQTSPNPAGKVLEQFLQSGHSEKDGIDLGPAENHECNDSFTPNNTDSSGRHQSWSSLLQSNDVDKDSGISTTWSGLTKRHKCPQERPYQCDLCEKRFLRLHDLKRHTKLHAGERLHVCPKCDRSFARGDALARHNKDQGGCAGRRSIINNIEENEGCGEIMRASDEDGMPAKASDDPDLQDDKINGQVVSKLKESSSEGVRWCHCDPHLPAERLQTKNGDISPGPWYYRCPKVDHKRCNFFLWDVIDLGLRGNESSLWPFNGVRAAAEQSGPIDRIHANDLQGQLPSKSSVPTTPASSTRFMEAPTSAVPQSSFIQGSIPYPLSISSSHSDLVQPSPLKKKASLGEYISRRKGALPATEMSAASRHGALKFLGITNAESKNGAVHATSDDSMSFIESQILGELSERKTTSASLAMDWDPLGFMKSQYPDNDRVNLGSVITLSGTVQIAQATTCSEYALQTWPLQGMKVVTAFQSAIDSREKKAQVMFSGLEISIDLEQGTCVLNVKSNNIEIITEVFQQAIWMGAVLRVSGDQRVQYSTFNLEPPGAQDTLLPSCFKVTFDTSELSNEEQSCWLPIFANPVIARGFPVSERENGEQGLEVPLEIMAALGGARHVTEFEGGLVLKGYSAMLVPIERHEQSIQWHLIRNSNDERMRYRQLRNECLNRAMLEEVDYDALRTTRAFLGWWKSSETHLGTEDAAYDSIDWSPAGEAKRPTRFSGGNIGFQTMITAQLNFIMGAKDGRLHFSQKGPFQRIVQCAEETPVVLYDLEDRRAWFVPALDVMLHIVQTRHHLSPYKVGGEIIKLTPANPKNGRNAATEAFAANQSRQLYERDVAAEKNYYFKDAILDIWSQMERLMDKEDSIEACSGLALHGTMQSKVHGWEFMSLVHEKNYRRKEATISKSSGGWVDLINDVDALVLFATGLDEIIKPVSDLSSLCRPWKSLPKGKDYLATGVPILELLYSEAGSRLSRKHLSTSHLQWHRGSTLFEQCSGAASHRCECDRTQQIYYDSLFKTFGHVRPPGNLKENGCVIFGQAHHPLKGPKTVTIRQNAVHMLPNTSIQNGEITKQISTKDDGLLSPSPPASVSPEPDQIRGYAIRSSKRPLPPMDFVEDLLQEEPGVRKRRRESRDNTTIRDTRKGPNNGDDQTLSSDDCVTGPVEYQSMLRPDTLSNRPLSGFTQPMCAPKAGYAPTNGRKAIRHVAKIEDYSHRLGCSLHEGIRRT
ncbi:MAG: hypothetical protein ASARMPREDX12_005851 [Alectoria sarmentosa]|nr:MAG: hypothetical protein ASARMPREDX12_005851 [Alectoria sarmentosa]